MLALPLVLGSLVALHGSSVPEPPTPADPGTDTSDNAPPTSPPTAPPASAKASTQRGTAAEFTLREPPDSPIEVRRWVRTLPDGPAVVYVATVNLTDPRVRLIVTGPIERRADEPAATEARLEPVPDWAARTGATVAINANYFGHADGKPGAWTLHDPVNIVGPCISGGVVVSAAETDPLPTFVRRRNGTAQIGMFAAPDLADVRTAIAGAPNHQQPAGSLILTNGVNTGADAAVAPLKRHPRTAVGLDAAGQTLYLVVVDGRQPGVSIGMTLPELADTVHELGADDAINLDGGGSSSFYFDPDGTGPRTDLITNSPSEKAWRPVGASLGVRIDLLSPSAPHAADAAAHSAPGNNSAPVSSPSP